MFDDSSNEEMQLYRAYLEQVSPGADPNFFGLYAWSAARLFVESAVALGGDLDPRLVGPEVRDGPQTGPPTVCTRRRTSAARRPGKCQKIIRFTGGSWKQVSKGDYLCGDLVSTGLGA